MFIDASLRRTCAVIGAKLTHSQPGKPQGRGKIERFFRTVRDQFLVEVNDSIAGTGTPVSSLAELNSLFDAWVHQVYHRRVHSETDQTPLQRFLAHGAPTPVSGDMLADAFRWGEYRTVTSTAQVNLHGNLYDVDPSLVGTKVELVFDPSDMENIEVRAHSRSYGKAVPSRIRRHVHPKAQTEPNPAPTPTGIDYLRLIEARHTRSLENRLQYAHLDHATDPTHSPDSTSNPDPDLASDTPTPGATADPGQPDAHNDDEASRYETDLVALADLTGPTGAMSGPGPAPNTPDPVLEAELAGFAGLLADHLTDPDDNTTGDPEPDAPDATRDDDAQEAS
jgi:putative transposase